MGQLVPDPERNQIGRESHPVGLGIHPPGEVLQADERYAAPPDDQLPGIGAAEATIR